MGRVIERYISERIGRGVPKITEAYGRETYEFRENSIVVSIPFTRVSTEESTPVTTPVSTPVTTPVENLIEDNAQTKRILDLKSIADFRGMCTDAIGDSGIKICIENCDGFPQFQKDALQILLGSPVVGLTFDIGHNRLMQL